MSGHLSIWTIYDHPTDYPNCFVAREYRVDGGADPVATSNMMACPDIDVLRGHFLQIGLTCMARSDGDDPAIVESWL